MPLEELQMHNCKKNGWWSRRESTIWTTKTWNKRKEIMLIKPSPSLKWDKSSRMSRPSERKTWSRKCNNTIKCLPRRRETESPNGSKTNKLRMPLKLRELTWVISCKRTSPPPNLNWLLTDSCHTTSRVSEKNKSKILLLKETNRS